MLVLPAIGLSAAVVVMLLIAAGPRDGWSVLLNTLAFFAEGIGDPLRCGWRILGLLAVAGFVVGAGAIPALRTKSFHGLALVATVGIAFVLFEASRVDRYNVINALIVLSPSFAGIVACVWFATKFKV